MPATASSVYVLAEEVDAATLDVVNVRSAAVLVSTYDVVAAMALNSLRLASTSATLSSTESTRRLVAASLATHSARTEATAA